jgi:hypothetical protein
MHVLAATLALLLLLAGCSAPSDLPTAVVEPATPDPVLSTVAIDEPEGTASPPPCAAGVCATGADDGVFAELGLDEGERLVAIEVTLEPAIAPLLGSFRVSLECLSRGCAAPVLLAVEGELPLTLAGEVSSPDAASLQLRFESLQPTAGLVGSHAETARALGHYTVQSVPSAPA